MADLSWRYARASDIDEYYGQRPRTTLNAVVILLDGKPAAIIGISREGGYGKFFSEYKPELEPHLSRVTVGRALMGAMKLVREYRMPVLSATDTEKGHRTLRKLGFTQLDDETYGCNLQRQSQQG